jgi:hypothetical protein
VRHDLTRRAGGLLRRMPQWLGASGSGGALSRRSNAQPVVYVELVGGLGNQLFGFAAALNQGRRLSCTVIMNHVAHEGDTPRSLLLQPLMGDSVTVGSAESAVGCFAESSFRYDANIDRIQPGTLLRGYFQSHRYIGPREPMQRRLTEAAIALRRPAPFSEAPPHPFIAVHVRGGDYRQPRTRAFHGLCTPRYFAESVELLRRRVGDLPAYIFADDEEGYAMGLASIPRSHRYWGSDEVHPLLILADMAQSSALVISNSSFGWWGAWMSESAHVVAPDPWFADPAVDTSDLLPDSWTTMRR